MIPSIFPKAGVNHKFPLALPLTFATIFYALTSWFVWDYVVRSKVSGTSVAYFYLKQFAAPPPQVFAEPAAWDRDRSIGEWLDRRVLELTYTSRDLESFARYLGDDGRPFRWNEERRKLFRVELDAAFFHVYGISREDLVYIMETFPVVKREDEVTHGSYWTKEKILSAYDSRVEAASAGFSYQSPLNPPPGEGERHT